MEQDIKIFMLSPFAVKEIYITNIHKKFHEMITDILRANLTINIDGKSHEIKANFVYVNNKENKSSKIDRILVHWLDTYINFLSNKWPIINSIKFEQVWEWLNHRTNFMEGISKTPIDRALNALTYTMGDTSYEEIFYVLMGIEALYNDNITICQQ